jgi:hypothetical protein
MTGHRFTNEEVALLAECERKMDAGEIPFVMMGGVRLATNREVMEELKLVQGQTVTPFIHHRMLEIQIALLQAKLAIERARGRQP